MASLKENRTCGSHRSYWFGDYCSPRRLLFALLPAAVTALALTTTLRALLLRRLRPLLGLSGGALLGLGLSRTLLHRTAAICLCGLLTLRVHRTLAIGGSRCGAL